MKETSYNKKDTFDLLDQMFPVFWVAPEFNKSWIRCFFYLNKSINTSINNISITRHKKCSLFVMISPPFYLLTKLEGKASDISSVSELIVTD